MAKNYAQIETKTGATIPTPLVVVSACVCVVAIVATVLFCTRVRDNVNQVAQQEVTSERAVDYTSAAANARGVDPARVVSDTTRIQRAVTSALTIGDTGVSAARDAAVANGLDPNCDMCTSFLAGGSDLSMSSEPAGTPDICLVGVDGDTCTYLATVTVRAGVGEYRSERRVHVVARTTSADSAIDATCAYENQGA